MVALLRFGVWKEDWMWRVGGSDKDKRACSCLTSRFSDVSVWKLHVFVV